jgi:hypothetical protein
MSFSAGSWELTLNGPLAIAATALLVLALAWSLAGAWRRLAGRSKTRWLAVAVLNVVAAACLLLLLTPATIEQEADNTVTLVTEGGANRSGPVIGQAFVLPGGQGDGQGLFDPAQLPLRDPSIGRIDVRGHGLDVKAWRSLPDRLTVNFDPPPLEAAVEIAWDREIPVGAPFDVTGRWHSNGKPASVRLVDPVGLVADETRVSPGERFSLAARPRAAGVTEYRLEVESAAGAIVDEPIGVAVFGGQALRTTIIQSAPSFETRQLSNWAADLGSAVTVISGISRDRTISQGVNLDTGETPELSPGMLARQDLVVIDGRALAALPGVHQDWLEEAVVGGLGLLVVADADLAGAMDSLGDKLLSGFTLVPNEANTNEAIPVWEGMSAPGPISTAALDLSASDGVILVASESGRPLDLARPLGLGRVAVSILRERHGWRTSGAVDVFSSYWANLMREVARPDNTTRLRAPASDAFYSAGQRDLVCAEHVRGPVTARIVPPARSGMPATEWPLTTDALGSAIACAPWWPDAHGWHEVQLLDGNRVVLDRQYRRVLAPDEWLGERRYRRQQATLERAAANQSGPEALRTILRSPLKPFWPWLLFVLSASALWLERKMDFEG